MFFFKIIFKSIDLNNSFSIDFSPVIFMYANTIINYTNLVTIHTSDA